MRTEARKLGYLLGALGALALILVGVLSLYLQHENDKNISDLLAEGYGNYYEGDPHERANELDTLSDRIGYLRIAAWVSIAGGLGVAGASRWMPETKPAFPVRVLNAAPQEPAAPATNQRVGSLSPEQVAERLSNLAALRDGGTISDSEYQTQRDGIIRQI